MNQEIKYNGLTANTSGYDCPDGELEYSLNLLNEGAGLKALGPESGVSMGGKRALCLHKVVSGKYYIVSNGSSLYSRAESGTETKICDWSGYPAVTPIGNILFIHGDSAKLYVLWKDGAYKVLGSEIPEVKLQFALKDYVDKDYKKAQDVTISFTEGDSERRNVWKEWVSPFIGNLVPYTGPIPEDSVIEKFTQSVLAVVNKHVAEATEAGCFTQPFLIRWAYRLFDGTHTHQSPPIIMWPIGGFFISYKEGKVKDGTCSLTEAVFHSNSTILCYNLTGLSNMTDWLDVVDGIDIYVSAPIYIYNQAGKVKPLGWYHYSNEYSYKQFSGIGEPLAGSTIGDAPVSNNSDVYFSVNAPETIPLPTTEKCILSAASFTGKEIDEKILNTSAFYHLASFDFQGDNKVSDCTANLFRNVPIEKQSLLALVTHETLPDDYRTHEQTRPIHTQAYNNRLLFLGTREKLFAGFPLIENHQYRTFESSDGNVTGNVECWVKVERNGKTYWVKSTNKVYHTYSSPGFIFYPDPNAKQVVLGVTKVFNLKTHPKLNGAYFLANHGYWNNEYSSWQNTTTTCTENSLIEEPNKILQSEINNPFLFPVGLRTSVGTNASRIHTVATSAKPLSQGQFGQFPLYAFTDEGVWALEVGGTGTISSRQPITRDVCTNADTICSVDQGVLFCTDRGIMQISGSQTQCITDSLLTSSPFDISTLPGMAKLHALIGHTDKTCFPVIPFLDYIKGCRIAYDYVHQRVYAFNPAYTYAYVLSMKTGTWGMLVSDIVSTLNSYPECLVTRSGGKVADLCKDGAPLKGLLVSRPLKLGDPSALKTVSTVIQRGQFAKGHVKSVLWGSRDLEHWHLVWSSQDHRMNGFRGTPYKYFRIGLVTAPAISERITGATVEFTPRFQNKLR